MLSSSNDDFAGVVDLMAQTGASFIWFCGEYVWCDGRVDDERMIGTAWKCRMNLGRQALQVELANADDGLSGKVTSDKNNLSRQLVCARASSCRGFDLTPIGLALSVQIPRINAPSHGMGPSTTLRMPGQLVGVAHWIVNE